MKRRNPFGAIVWLRSVEEKRKRSELGAAKQSFDDARARLEAMKERYRDDRALDEMLSPVQLRSLQLRGLASLELLEAAAEAVDRSRRELDARAEAWRKAAADSDAAERHQLHEKQEAARHARMAAERSLSDLQPLLRRSREQRS